MFALFLTLITLTDLNRLIGAIADERHATHRKMVGTDLQAVISPLSDEWAALAARWSMLSEMSDAAYAELARRERGEIQRCEQEAPFTDVPMVCTACRQPVTYIGGDPERGMVGGEWIHTSRTAVKPCIRDYPVKAMVAAGNESVPTDV